jgi:carbamoyltransferase
MKRRGNDQEIEQVHADLACAIQKVTTEIILKLARTAKVLTGCKNLCLAGGVALNSVANGEIRNSSLFEKIWIQPAAGDAGGALGAALAFYYLGGNQVNRIVERSDGMRYGFLGTALVDKEIEMFCKRNHLKYDYFKDKNLLNHVIAKDLVQNKIVGWVQGRMEFGPRALGARSILASPFEADMQHKLNMAVKFREDFRPFAPVMLLGEAEKYFGVSEEIPFMQYVHKLKEEARIEENNSIKTNSLVDKLNVPRSPFQAVTHVDYSARMQVVDNENHPLYGLLQKFKEETGIGMLVNTSFNTNGEPIVCSIEDAFACFNKTKIDILVLNNYIFRK